MSACNKIFDAFFSQKYHFMSTKRSGFMACKSWYNWLFGNILFFVDKRSNKFDIHTEAGVELNMAECFDSNEIDAKRFLPVIDFWNKHYLRASNDYRKVVKLRSNVTIINVKLKVIQLHAFQLKLLFSQRICVNRNANIHLWSKQTHPPWIRGQNQDQHNK